MSLKTSFMCRSCTYDKYDKTLISVSMPNDLLAANSFIPYFNNLKTIFLNVSFQNKINAKISRITYLEMIFCGKQLPSRATTQSKCGAFCIYVLSKQLMNSSSSCSYNRSKQDTVRPSKHRIALEPSQILHLDPMSMSDGHRKQKKPKSE